MGYGTGFNWVTLFGFGIQIQIYLDSDRPKWFPKKKKEGWMIFLELGSPFWIKFVQFFKYPIKIKNQVWIRIGSRTILRSVSRSGFR